MTLLVTSILLHLRAGTETFSGKLRFSNNTLWT
jgi:hypothetical protein